MATLSTPSKVSPIVDIYAYPLAAVGVWRRGAFALCDRLSVLNRSADANGAGSSGTIGFSGQYTQPQGAAQGGDIESVNNLQWVTLKDDQDKTGISGYVAAPRYCPLNSLIDDRVNPPSDRMCLIWQTQNANGWTTCLPDIDPAATAIRWTRAEWVTTRATTQRPIPQGQDFRVEVWLDGAAKPAAGQDVRPFLRLGMGDIKQRYGVYWVQGDPTSWSREYVDATASQSAWKTLRQPGWLDEFWSGGTVTFDVRHVAGRIWLVSPDGQQQMCYTDRQRGAQEQVSLQLNEGKVRPSVIGAGPFTIEASGCSFGMRFHEIAYADDEWVQYLPDEPPIARPTNEGGSFTRKFGCPYGPDNVQFPTHTAVCHGYPPLGATVSGGGPHTSDQDIATAQVNQAVKQRVARYDCTVKVNAADATSQAVEGRTGLWEWGGAYAMRGHSTGFVHSVSLQANADAWLTQSLDPINIRPACKTLREDLSDPAISPRASWDGEFDRYILRDCAAASGGGTVGDNWKLYVGRNHQCIIEVAWQYSDGVTRAYQYDGLDVGGRERMVRLVGYFESLSPRSEPGAERLLNLRMADQTFRLQAPAAVIKGNFVPLDFLMAQKMAAGGVASLTGFDAVQYILYNTLGPAASDNLQYVAPVTGRPPSLLDWKLFTDPPSGEGFIWAPPFGQSAWNWIQSLCEAEFNIFYWQNTGDRWAKPVYGDYFGIVHGAPTTVVTDAVAHPGDENKVVRTFSLTGLPQQDLNDFVVWGQAPGQTDLGGLMPALPAFSSEIRLDRWPQDTPNMEQAIALTWERTLVKQGTKFWLPAMAQAVCIATAAVYKGMNVRKISANMRGLEWLCWGHKLQFNMTAPMSDPDLDLTGRTFRVMRVVNDYQLDRNQWRTTALLAEQPFGR